MWVAFAFSTRVEAGMPAPAIAPRNRAGDEQAFIGRLTVQGICSLQPAHPPARWQGPYGGTGRRVRLKIGFRKECWFDSG